MRTFLLLAAAGAALTACEPTVVAPAGTAYDLVTLTGDGPDTVVVAGTPDFTTVSAPLGNTGANLRAAWLPAGSAASAEQAVCATWSGSTHAVVQEGALLRWTGTTGITVTKNVWLGTYTSVNIHRWDLARPVGDGRFTLLAAFPLPAIAGPGGGPRPLPWRLCASASADRVRFELWPLTRGEPAAGDACCTGSVALPATGPGRAGWYAGHLRPGHTVAYTALTGG